MKLESISTETQSVHPLHLASRWSGVFLACLVACLFVGCTPSSSSSSGTAEGHGHEHEHDHGHRPSSYTAAISQVKHARDEVKAAFDAGTPQECDDALHVLAEVLPVLPDVAAETDLPKEDWQVVSDQSKALFASFMKIHDGFHGGSEKGVSFDSVSEEINSAIEVLESKIAATGEKVEEVYLHGHDHDHDDHDHDHDEHDHGDHDHDDHGHDDHDHGEGEHDHGE